MIDVNEAPFGITISGKAYIPENLPPGTVIGALYTADDDINQKYTYNITSMILLQVAIFLIIIIKSESCWLLFCVRMVGQYSNNNIIIYVY